MHADSTSAATPGRKGLSPGAASFICSGVGALAAFIPLAGWLLAGLLLTCGFILSIVAMCKNQIGVGIAAFISNTLAGILAVVMAIGGLFTTAAVAAKSAENNPNRTQVQTTSESRATPGASRTSPPIPTGPEPIAPTKAKYPYMGTLSRPVTVKGQYGTMTYNAGTLANVLGPDRVVSGDNTPLPVREADVNR